MDWLPDVPARLTAALFRSGLSGAEAARRAGVPQSQVSLWLRGERVPRADLFAAFCLAIGASADAILWGDAAATLPGYSAGVAAGKALAAEAVRALDLTNAAHALRIAGMVTPPPEQSPTPLPPPASQHPPRRRSRG
jgi:transcriptional regulator with XRE-family HTH domain